MAFAKVLSAQNIALKTHLVSVEIDLSFGLHAFSIVGLPDKGIEESKDRVGAAIKNSGYKSPKQTNKKITVSLAPADMRKEGPLFDLPIALAYLLAAKDISFNPKDKIFAGELALDGSIRPIRGALLYARLAKELGMKEIYIPKENEHEAALIDGISVFGVHSLREIIDHLTGKSRLKPALHLKNNKLAEETNGEYPDFGDIAGNESAKRGLMIALAGGHNIALFGPPGTGKTMLAKGAAGIVPDLSFEEMLDVMEIYSASSQDREHKWSRPPLRAPHHTSSYSAIIGGGAGPRPGEMSLAHHGILFMDEFPEFDSRVIEALRQPLEERTVSISRSRGDALFPASFTLILAFNPCPCGKKDVQGKICICTAKDVERYKRKLSGPIIDRIDMWIEVSKVDHEKLMLENKKGESLGIRKIIERVRSLQQGRFQDFGKHILLNAHARPEHMKKVMRLEKEAEKVLQKAAKTYDLSGRGYHRVIKLARTIADIDESQDIQSAHILEALNYRQKTFN